MDSSWTHQGLGNEGRMGDLQIQLAKIALAIERDIVLVEMMGIDCRVYELSINQSSTVSSQIVTRSSSQSED